MIFLPFARTLNSCLLLACAGGGIPEALLWAQE